jgi:plastocyanin
MTRVIGSGGGARLIAAASLLASCTIGPRAAAQGTVAGVLALQEQPGREPGDVRTAVVYLEGRERVASDVDAATPRSGTIAMRGREFVPHVRAVLAGGTVAFPNEDPFSHNVFSNVELGPFDLGLYRRGATRTASFPRPGVYPIYCNIHSKMVSFVIAVPGTLVAQPDADGRFLLHRVPAGRYLLHAWHERGGDEVVRELVVPASGIEHLQVDIDARAYVAAPHLNKFGRPYVVMRADRY